jgi:hypothetical protein
MRDEDGHQAMLETGRAWRRIKKGQQRLWRDWTLVIGPGLMKARAEAMAIAGTNQPKGRGYNTAMADLLHEYQVDDMGETARAHIFKIMEHYAEVEEWRAKQKDPGDLNHPSRVWLKFQRSAQQQDERDAERAEPKPSKSKQTEDALAWALEEIEELKAQIDRQRAYIEELEAALKAAGITLPATQEAKQNADAA